MSVFSDMLQNYVHEKNVKVSALASYCGMERSTFYKFIVGKREPGSVELVEKIAHFIKLTPLETQQLREAWKMARIGEITYYTRKSVEHFLSDFPNKSALPIYNLSNGVVANLTDQLSSKNCLLLNSRQTVDFSVHQILLEEAAKANGKIALFLQPDYTFLFQLLSTIQPSGSLQIDHIFSLSRTPQFTESHELYEFYYLRNMFPIYMNHIDYHTYCFYTNETVNSQNLSTLPYLILTSKFAITCSSDYQTGILYHDTDIVASLWNLFSSRQTLCQPVFQTFPIATDNLPSLFQYIDRTRASTDLLLFIQPEACIIPFLHGSMVKELFNTDLPMAEAIIPMAEALVQKNMKAIHEERFIIYFTESGMTRFLHEGLIEEIPSILYHPLNIKQRVYVLREIAKCCRGGSYRILKKPLDHLPENIRMALCETACSFTYQANSGDHMCFAVTEPFILQVFQDFLKYMDPELYYEPEEAAQIIEQQILELESTKH